jgi:hypothetical protein
LLVLRVLITILRNGFKIQIGDRAGVEGGCHVGRRCKLARCRSVCEATMLVTDGVRIGMGRFRPRYKSKVVAWSSVTIFQVMSVRNGTPWNLY